MNHVPLVDLRAQFESIKAEVMTAIEGVLESSQLFLGPHTQAFEAEYAAYCGARHAIGVANGTDAVHLALRAAGIGAGDEVITVSHTFIATIEGIIQAGAQPVLVDIDPRTYTIDVEQIQRHITSRTRAILPVHLYGRLADTSAIRKIARRNHLLVIEDAAQAQGATDAEGRRAGAIGDVGCFSFYYAKNLGAYGEAGAITTSDPELDRRIRRLRTHGEDVRYQHAVLGYNSRIDEIQSAILRIKLRHLDHWNALRVRHAQAYDALLKKADSDVVRPELVTDGSHVYHQYVVRVGDRDGVRARMQERGVGTGVHYPIPCHLQPALRQLGYAPGDLPVTEKAANEILSLPMYPELTQAQLEHVASELSGARMRVA